MSIVCRTDYSEASVAAATAAAYLAVRTNEPLHLVHSLALPPERPGARRGDAIRVQAAAHLARLIEHLHHLDADVHAHLSMASPEDALDDASKRYSARLIVTAERDALDANGGWSGANARHMALRSRVPVLIVRDAKPFDAWVRKGYTLRVALAPGVAQTSDALECCVQHLSNFGPCEIRLARAHGTSKAENDPSADLIILPCSAVEFPRSAGGLALDAVIASGRSSVVYVPAAARTKPNHASPPLHLDRLHVS